MIKGLKELAQRAKDAGGECVVDIVGGCLVCLTIMDGWVLMSTAKISARKAEADAIAAELFGDIPYTRKDTPLAYYYEGEVK